MRHKNLFMSVAFLTMLSVHGQTLAAGSCSLTSLMVQPEQIKTGQKMTVYVNGMASGSIQTQLLYSIDNGQAQPLLGTSSFPVSKEIPGLAAAGSHTISVWSTSSTGHPDVCNNKVTKTINVAAPVLAGPVAGMNLGVSPVACPAGWELVPGPASGGAFTCKAKKPVTKIQCPPKTQYYENDCTIGCQQVIY